MEKSSMTIVNPRPGIHRRAILLILLAAIAGVFALQAAQRANATTGPVIYNSIPATLAPNVASLGFEATSTSEFGDYIHLGGTDRGLNTVTVTMSNWALYSDFASDPLYSGNSSTWTHPITVNVYNVAAGPAVGTLLATITQNINIPWRPVGDPTCPNTGYGLGFAWRAGDGSCYNGIAFNATFDLSSLNVTLPNDVIVGVAYNTADYGAVPIHAAGPYNSLNVGIPTGQTPTVGTDDNADNVFWNTTYPGYTAGFRQDTGWTPNGTVSFRITANPTCTPTGLMRDNINLTARQIGGTVTGTLDATGCNIGVYNPTSVTGADIFGANYYGVVVDGGTTPVDVTGASIHNIGEATFNGAQHGRAIYYVNGASGTVSGNTVSLYQKNGIVIAGTGTAVTVSDNTVTGAGPINYIAQNGIVIQDGATALVTGNTVSGNDYTPTDTVACGILFYNAGGVKQSKNVLSGNEVNICNAGRGGGKFNSTP